MALVGFTICLFHDMMFSWLVGLGLDIRLGKRVLVGWLVGWLVGEKCITGRDQAANVFDTVCVLLLTA
jgi:hypothetical protein